MKVDFLYRFNAICYRDDYIRITLNKYQIFKYTPRGCWIYLFSSVIPESKKFVLAGTRKKFACETVELAAESFIARKRKQVSILKAQLISAEKILNFALVKQSKGESLEGEETSIWKFSR